MLPMNLVPEKVELVVLACVALHNSLKINFKVTQYICHLGSLIQKIEKQTGKSLGAGEVNHSPKACCPSPFRGATTVQQMQRLSEIHYANISVLKVARFHGNGLWYNNSPINFQGHFIHTLLLKIDLLDSLRSLNCSKCTHLLTGVKSSLPEPLLGFLLPLALSREYCERRP